MCKKKKKPQQQQQQQQTKMVELQNPCNYEYWYITMHLESIILSPTIDLFPAGAITDVIHDACPLI